MIQQHVSPQLWSVVWMNTTTTNTTTTTNNNNNNNNNNYNNNNNNNHPRMAGLSAEVSSRLPCSFWLTTYNMSREQSTAPLLDCSLFTHVLRD